jgi:hypothetical protein
MKKEDLLELRELLRRYREIRSDGTALQRAEIILGDPEAPICINCEYCVQEGVLFICTLYQLPEYDERVVGNFGVVYWKRKGRVKRYPNVPMRPEDCKTYSPLVPRELLKKFLQGEL